MSAAGQCPECTYSLQGLTTRRCPECGVELHPRLLTEPHLAIPRPAWERRPRVSRTYAFWRTFWDITRHPKQFFASMQYPDRLWRALRWYVYMVVIAWAVAYLPHFLLAYNGFVSAALSAGFLRGAASTAAQSILEARFGFAIVALPVMLLLLVADFLFWWDRPRYRLLAKAVLYSSVVYVWFAVAFACNIGVCVVISQIDPLMGTWLKQSISHWAWPNWLIAAMFAWQFMLLWIAVGQRRFAILQLPRPHVHGVVSVLVAMACVLGMYLVLFDCLLGWRFVTGMWGVPEL